MQEDLGRSETTPPLGKYYQIIWLRKKSNQSFGPIRNMLKSCHRIKIIWFIIKKKLQFFTLPLEQQYLKS